MATNTINITLPIIGSDPACIPTYIWIDLLEGWNPSEHCGGYQFAYESLEEGFGPESLEVLNPTEAETFYGYAIINNEYQVPIFEIG